MRNSSPHPQARRYASIRYRLALADLAFTLALLVLFLWSGMSLQWAGWMRSHIPSPWAADLAYLTAIAAGYFILQLPVTYYSSFVLEHSFGLSTQGAAGWCREQAKSAGLGYALFMLVAAAWFFIVPHFPRYWWLVVSGCWILFTVLLARIAPVLIVPLFFKYRKLEDSQLRQRILSLAGKMRVPVLDCFEIDFSKKTLKANAGLLGMGRTRRVVLADTLRERYTHDEIEAILAHEFAHHKLRHMPLMVAANALASGALFYAIYRTSSGVVQWLGLGGIGMPAAFPLVCAYATLFSAVMQPLHNFISRCFERQADRMAVEATGNPGAFISMMEKLGAQNLSDPAPSALVKAYFFDHPPVQERIAMAKGYCSPG